MSVAVVMRYRRPIADIVLGIHGSPSWRPAAAGAGIGLATAAVVLGLGALVLSSRRASSPDSRVRPTREISLEEPMERVPPPLPPPAAPASAPRPPVTHAARVGVPSARVEPAPAARILSQEPRPDDPLDLTDDLFVAGNAPRAIGGATSPAGAASAGTPRGGTSVGAGAAARGRPGGASSDLSRPVSLAGESWSCPWPSEAEPLLHDEQTVVIRVVARSDGTVEAVTVMSDPGHGFGEAAARCARQARFLPARASNGQPVRAASPPILVRFTR